MTIIDDKGVYQHMPQGEIRLMLLDAQLEVFQHGVVIIAYEVTDGKGQRVSGFNTKHEAVECAKRFAARYPQSSFFVNKERVSA